MEISAYVFFFFNLNLTMLTEHNPITNVSLICRKQDIFCCAKSCILLNPFSSRSYCSCDYEQCLSCREVDGKPYCTDASALQVICNVPVLQFWWIVVHETSSIPTRVLDALHSSLPLYTATRRTVFNVSINRLNLLLNFWINKSVSIRSGRPMSKCFKTNPLCRICVLLLWRNAKNHHD